MYDVISPPARLPVLHSERKDAHVGILVAFDAPAAAHTRREEVEHLASQPVERTAIEGSAVHDRGTWVG
jgi:hypothetical protein